MASYIALALAAIFAVPVFGRRVLAFLRDLAGYRASRPVGVLREVDAMC